MKKFIFLSVAFVGYALGASELESLAIQNSYEIKALKAKLNVLRTEVDLSDTWENPVLKIGANDILFDEPLRRDKEPMQNESITISQKIPTASKLTIKKGIATVDVSIGEAQLDEMILSVKKEMRILEHTLKKINTDLLIVQEYESVLEKLNALHVAYNYSSSHYADTFQTMISSKNIAIQKHRLLASQQSTIFKIESIINQKIPKAMNDLLTKANYTLKNEEEKVLSTNPTLKKMRLFVQKSAQNTTFNQALEIPDVTLSLGYYHRDGFDDYAAVSVAMPLPVYGKEKLGVQKAMQLRHVADENLRAAENKLLFELKNMMTQKAFMENQILLNQEILSEKEKIYENIKDTASTQQNGLLGSLTMVMQMLDSKLKINQYIFEYNQNIEAIKSIVGEE